MKMSKIIFVVFALLILTLVIYKVLDIRSQNQYNLQRSMFGYAWPIGVRTKSIEELIEAIGQPEKCYQRWYSPGIYYTSLEYDEFIVNYVHLDNSPLVNRFAHIEIKEPSVALWRRNVGIGSSHNEVLWAFRNVPKDGIELNAYIDTFWCVKFVFSSEDIVTSILLY